MAEQKQAAPFIDGLYGKLVEDGVGYFFPSAQFDLLEPDLDPGEHRIERTSLGTSLNLNWLGSRYSLARDEPFSEAELRLLTSIGAVLDSRYRMIVDATQVEQRFELFRGLPEDRYVSAYIDGAPYAQKVWEGPDRVEDAMRSFARVRSAPTKTGVSRLVRYFSAKTQILATNGRSRLRALCATLQR